MDVDLEGALVAGHEDRLADRLEVVTDGVDVERSMAVGLEQEHRLVAEPLIGMGHKRRRLWPDRRTAAPHGRAPGEVEQRPLEEPVQALAARIHHAGLAQDRQQRRRARDRPLRRGQRGTQDHLDVVVALGGLDRPGGRLPDDREDRALDRLGDCAIRGPCALRQGVCQVEPVEPALAAERLRHAPEDLAGDDAGVAAGAHERAEADGSGDPLGRLAGHVVRLVEGGLDRGEHVRARVAVGHRIDIEAVDLLDVCLEVRHRRPEGLEEAVPVARPTGHLGDVRAAVGQIARPDRIGRGGGCDRGRRTAGRHVQPVDVDGDARHIAIERPADGVAHRRVDLPRHLGHGDTQRDGEVEVDVDAVIDADGQPGLIEPQPLHETAERATGSPGKAGDTVRADGGEPNDVAQGAGGDEGTAGCRTDGHAGGVLP